LAEDKLVRHSRVGLIPQIGKGCVDTGGELSALLGTPEFMRLTLTQEWGFDEFATSVCVGHVCVAHPG
jgi:hypothetical protein